MRKKNYHFYTYIVNINTLTKKKLHNILIPNLITSNLKISIIDGIYLYFIYFTYPFKISM